MKPYTSRTSAELFYKQYDPVYAAQVLYGLCLLFMLLWVTFKKQVFIRPAILCYGLAFIAHISTIALRLYILDRPPVATLYESLLFTSLIITGFCLILERAEKSRHGYILGAIS